MKKKLKLYIGIIILFLVAVAGVEGYRFYQAKTAADEPAVEEEQKQITLWYTDEKLNAYLVDAAGSFEKETGTKVTLQLVNAVDYIEHINRSSISESGGPDLFITSSELLQKAKLAGLTVENDSFSSSELAEDFPLKAIDAATVSGKLVGYPFYFETSFLLYNKQYADSAPATIDEILEYSDSFEGSDETAAVENIFKWNVDDIFYNFFFIGNYVDLGGETGDDPSRVSLNASEVTDCLQYYQNLNGFFAIDADEVSTEGVLQEFIDGKIVYTIAKTDAIQKLDKAIEAGEIPEYSEPLSRFYGIAQVPDLTEELETKGLSVTNSVVVNAYSPNREESKLFAKYITYEMADDLYEMSGKMSVKSNVFYPNGEMQELIDSYENSVEAPKITDLSNYWIEMELTFEKIWRGMDVQEEIDDVTSRIMSQLTAE